MYRFSITVELHDNDVERYSLVEWEDIFRRMGHAERGEILNYERVTEILAELWIAGNTYWLGGQESVDRSKLTQTVEHVPGDPDMRSVPPGR